MRQTLSVECAKHEGVHDYRFDCRDWHQVVSVDMAEVEQRVIGNMAKRMEHVEAVLQEIGLIALSGADSGCGYIFHAEQVREQLYRLLTEDKHVRL